jgi:hypothetical protein
MNRISHQNFLNKNETNSKMELIPYTSHTKTLYRYAAGRISNASFASHVSLESHLADKSWTDSSPLGLVSVIVDRKNPKRASDIITPAKNIMSVLFG